MANTMLRVEKRRPIHLPRRAAPTHTLGGPSSPATSSTEHVLPEDVLETCKCNYCNCYLTVGPIHMVDNKIACGRCRQESSGPRLMVLEVLAKQFKYPCRYKNTGCKAYLKWALVNSHENVCGFRKLHCTITDCNWVGIKSFLRVHFDQNHPSQVISSRKNILLNLLEIKPSNYLYVLEHKIFFVELYNDGKNIHHQVKFFYSNVALQCIYNIRIFDFEKELMFLNQKLTNFDHKYEYENPVLSIAEIQTIFKNKNITIELQIKEKNEVEGIYDKCIECPGCLKSMLGNISVAQCGHSFCEKCRKSLYNCPYCKVAPLTNLPGNYNGEIRNFSLETLIKKLHFK